AGGRPARRRASPLVSQAEAEIAPGIALDPDEAHVLGGMEDVEVDLALGRGAKVKLEPRLAFRHRGRIGQAARDAEVERAEPRRAGAGPDAADVRSSDAAVRRGEEHVTLAQLPVTRRRSLQRDAVPV